MKIEFHATIKIDPNGGLEFSEEVKYTSPAGIEVILNNHDKDSDALSAKFSIESSDLGDAQSLVEAELLRLSNLLAWNKQVKVLSARIGGYQYSQKKGQQSAHVFGETLHLSDHVSMTKTLNKKGVEILSQSLSKDVSDSFLDILTLWRDAVNSESNITKFFLLYRILEDYLGSRKQVDQWILQKYPNTEQRQTKKRMATIYTYLRDNIHPKPENKRFPSNDVSKNINALQGLVRELITDEFADAQNWKV